MSENIKDIYPLSPMQQGMLFHSIYSPESEVYTEQFCCKLTGELDITAFKKAWQAVVNRYDILRTAFVWEDLDEPLQVVQHEAELPFEILDWADKGEEQQDADFQELLKAERRRGLDLTEAPVMRILLIRLSSDAYRLVWNHHHVLIDGWGLPIVLNEVISFYKAFQQGRELHVPTPRPYRDYIAWLQQQDMDKARAFWSEWLKGFIAPTPLPVDHFDDGKTAGYARERIEFNQQDTDQLYKLAKDTQVTLNTLIQGAWAFLLSRYSGEDDIVFGGTVSGRPPELPGVETMLGLFINTLPVRVQIDPRKNVLAWLKEIQVRQAETRQYEYTPLVDIHSWSDVPNSQPLFDSILVFENYPVGEQLEQREAGLELTDVRSFERTNFPITLVGEPGRQLALDIAYETDKFDPRTIQRMLRHLRNILVSIAENVDDVLARVSLLSEDEWRQIVVDWNKTDTPYEADKTVQAQFEEAAAGQPEAVAVELGERTVTYKELDEQANRLAHYLRRQGVGPDVIVGLSVERSVEMIVAIFAILKAGGAYLPIDSTYPVERIRYILDDSGVALLLTTENLLQRFGAQGRALCLDRDRALYENMPATKPDVPILPENLAYMIYTSGSTGKPKGTLITHRGLNNYLHWTRKAYPLQKGRGSIVHSTIAFDATVTAVFTPILRGKTIALIPDNADVEELAAALQEYGDFSVVKITPAHLEMLTHQIPPHKASGLAHAFVIGGENLTAKQIRFWRENAPGTLLFNEYGPTETVVGCVVYEASGWHGGGSVPIGVPICNTAVYVLDESLEPVPVGVPGELYISGEGVARGYHNRPELTAERFLPDPFSKRRGARMYKTGDKVRYLPDGNLEFLGRIDFQVKIRGFRIELGEIEARLMEQKDVEEAIVLAREDTPGDKRLVGYIVAADGRSVDVQAVRDVLKTELPEYMIPAAIVVMDSFPLSANGKVNRKAFPPPDISSFGDSQAYVAPKTPEEELIAGIWADVLNAEKVGRHSNFFDLGGHSLLATQVVSRLRDAFEVDLQLRDLFETPTVEQVALAIDRLRQKEAGITAPPIEKAPRDQELPLSFAQQRLWFLDQLAPGSASYNIPSAMRISGKLNVEAFEKSLREIVRRHESLRTTFADKQGTPVQIVSDDVDFQLKQTDLSSLPEAEREQEVMRRAREDAVAVFDLAKGPLFRTHLIKLADEEYAFIFCMHHIISDGWSVGVLINETIQLYLAFSNDQPSPLPELELQYADFAAWQRKWLSGQVLQQQIDYWKEQLADAPPLLELPTDRPRPAMQTFNVAKEPLHFPAELSTAVRKLSRKLGVTPFMTLLAAFQALLHRYSGQDQVLVGSPIANRTKSEIEKLIGFFVNTLVLKADFSDNPTFEDLLLQVRETALGAFAHQDLPFEKLVEELHPERDMSHSPLFQVAFILQNAPMRDIVDLPDLKMQALESPDTTAKFDLTLTMIEAGDEFIGDMEYNTDLFDRETIVRMLDHLRLIVQQMTGDPEASVGALPLLTEKEKQQILYDWNRTEHPFPADKCVHQRFEDFVNSQPDAPALVYQERAGESARELSYAALNERANKLAHYLINKGVRPESIVGICMERSLDMAVSMLAILKAGGAYVPIDPGYPDDRIRYMIEDSALTVLLTQEGLRPRLAEHSAILMAVDAGWAEIEKQPAYNPAVSMHPDNLAYVIYTSGSTGKPKGTLLRHRGACNLAAAQKSAFDIKPGSRILQFASLSFDAATWEFVMAMLNGAALVLTGAETIASGEQLTEVLAAQKVTTVTLPPSVLAVWPKKELPDLRTIITAGEAVSGELAAEWGEGRQFVNAYGPTESTVCASMHECRGVYPQGPPIGKPIANFELYIVDRYMQPVPVGAAGELCIGGVGLARGYHNLSDLTAEKFIPNPFSSKPGERLYRTGDLVRYLPDGNIEFLGRIDFQVKVRGFRIELGEIEAVLSRHEQVKDLTVIVREDAPGDKRLAAYIVPADGVEPDVNRLRGYMRERLPDYMIPSAFVLLEALPLTPNGKVDRKALPKPEISRHDLSAEYIAPRNETEEKVAAIVSELLNVEKVGVNDNFFELGGHSLLATQFLSRLKTVFQVELPLRILFERPTTADIAEEVDKAKQAGPAPATPKIKRVARSARTVKRIDLEE